MRKTNIHIFLLILNRAAIFFYLNSNPRPGGYKLILASNRDEFFARPTKSVGLWKQSPSRVYGGIDLEPGREGGTWLAISEHKRVFKVGALLNLTGEPKPRNAEALKCQCDNQHSHAHHCQHNNGSSPSDTQVPIARISRTVQLPLHDNPLLLGRGMLVSHFVSNPAKEDSNNDYNRCLLEDCTKYSAFNFVSIEIGERSRPARIAICSNAPPTLEQLVERNCYGFGNSLPTVPFEKVRHGLARFEQIVNDFNGLSKNVADTEKLIFQLQDMLKCKHKHWPDAELQRRAPNWGEYLSALNVNVPHESYGSRTHSVILIDSDDHMVFAEETMATMNPSGNWQTTRIEEHFASSVGK